MRTTVLTTLLLAAATPLTAQTRVQQNIAIISGDTVVTIQRGDNSSCSVRVGGRNLDLTEAQKICEIKGRDMTITARGGAALAPLARDSVRWRFGMITDSLLASQHNMSAQVRELAARQRALQSEQLWGELNALRSQTAVIGVSIDPRPRDTDRWGAYVAGITPNFPAEKAGLRPGDIITSINGESLTSGRTERAASDEESLVWLRLSERVRKLEPGKEVNLVFRRDGSTRTVKITPVADSRWFATTAVPTATWSLFADSIPNRQLLELAGPEIRELMVDGRAPRALTLALASRIPNLELAPMNDALGRYFGTTQGVLVLDTPEENNLGLEPGDVVTSIDGRSVDTPAELIRVLRTYDKDKSFTIQVIRQKQTRSIAASLP